MSQGLLAVIRKMNFLGKNVERPKALSEEEGGKEGSGVIPEGFREIRQGRVIAWVRRAYSFLFDEAGNWLTDGPFCSADAVANRRGRGEMRKVSLGVKDEPCGLIRHYQRGGLIRHLLGDFYWGRERFFNEVRVAVQAMSRGLPTTQVLALRTEGKGWGFYRADLMTREIENSQDLDGYLQTIWRNEDREPFVNKRAVLRSVAGLLHKMHEAGLYHADLNLKNILVQFSGEGVKSYVIDLDRARMTGPLIKKKRIRNLMRLYRSLEKYGHIGSMLTYRDCIRFIRAYCQGEKEMKATLIRMIRKGTLSIRFHRLFWRISGVRGKP